MPGSGLGLNIAHGIARAHHGDLTVTSHPGETTFRFVLPAELRIGQLGIDFVARTVSHGGEPVHLTPKELDLLR